MICILCKSVLNMEEVETLLTVDRCVCKDCFRVFVDLKSGFLRGRAIVVYDPNGTYSGASIGAGGTNS